MGACFSNQIKAESPVHSVLNSKNVSRDTSNLSRSNSKLSSTSIPATPRSEGEILQSSNLKNFTFNELKTATRNFRPDSVLGEGGFGAVFKGWIDEHSLTPTRPGTGIVIAVKRLNQEGVQGHKEWLAEINYLGQLRHPNLVKLVGYCLEDEHRLLVYEFMPRGSMENHLFRSESYLSFWIVRYVAIFALLTGKLYIPCSILPYSLKAELEAGSTHFQPLSWSVRMKVALGAAKGLAYLHSDEAKVIYRDIKTSNILLDLNFNAKLSDFGLARDGPTGDKSYVSTRVMGTYGYAAPEYLATGHLNARSDIYSFGVVFLEMMTGRRAIDRNRPAGEHKLVEWAKPLLNNRRKVYRVMDTRIERQCSIDHAQKAANLALRCLSVEPKFRPSMEQVVKELEKLQISEDVCRNTPQNQTRVGHTVQEVGPYRSSSVGTPARNASSFGPAAYLPIKT